MTMGEAEDQAYEDHSWVTGHQRFSGVTQPAQNITTRKPRMIGIRRGLRSYMDALKDRRSYIRSKGDFFNNMRSSTLLITGTYQLSPNLLQWLAYLWHLNARYEMQPEAQ